jgi:hypothetical protein
MQMNGSSSFGRIPSSAAYRIQFPQTISAWVKINSHKVFQPIYASSDHVNSKYSGIILYLENGKPALTVGDNQGAGIQFRRSFVAGDSLKVGQWYHLVAVCSALGSTTMYVNGVAVTNGANSGTGNSMVHGTGYGFAGYLSEPNGGAARYFDGSIDELMVLSGEMTPTQISGLFKPAVYFTQEPSDTAVNNLASVLLKSKATGTLPVSFQWYHRINGSWVSLNTNKSSDLSIPSITIADTGLYRCIATITGHADTTRSARISLIPANHSGTQFINRYQLVPNPVQNEISIMNLSQPGFIKIIDGKGQVCFTGMIKAGEKISTAHFANGVYHLQVNNGSGTWSTLFVKI